MEGIVPDEEVLSVLTSVSHWKERIFYSKIVSKNKAAALIWKSSLNMGMSHVRVFSLQFFYYTKILNKYFVSTIFESIYLKHI